VADGPSWSETAATQALTTCARRLSCRAGGRRSGAARPAPRAASRRRTSPSRRALNGPRRIRHFRVRARRRRVDAGLSALTPRAVEVSLGLDDGRAACCFATTVTLRSGVMRLLGWRSGARGPLRAPSGAACCAWSRPSACPTPMQPSRRVLATLARPRPERLHRAAGRPRGAPLTLPFRDRRRSRARRRSSPRAAPGRGGRACRRASRSGRRPTGRRPRGGGAARTSTRTRPSPPPGCPRRG
jgi:hypothetical protein